MTRAREVDAQWATVDTHINTAWRGRTIGRHFETDAALAMPAGDEAAATAERREAALKITDMAAGQHPCELSIERGVKRCTHPDHDRDAAWAQAALDALGLPDTATEQPAPAAAPQSRPRARLERATFTRPDWTWQDDAACQGEDLVLFFGPDGERAAERQIREALAKEICSWCPVRTECLEYAVSRPEKYGIYGGLNEDERVTERRRWLRNNRSAA